jgi:large subunit ribosomal protein L21
MYAIVEIAGQQFKVEKDKKIFVHQLEGEEGSVVEFDKVLLIDNDGKVKVGKPTVKAAKILAHQKGDKVLVFKKKRRKGYKKLNGHRQQFTQIQIEEIITA